MRPDDHDRGTLATPEEMLAHSLWVRRLARALVLDDSAADDLAQDAWVTALETPPRASDAVRPWFGRVLRNLAISRHRSETRRTRRETIRPTREPAPGSDEVAISIETQQILLDAVRELRDPLRSTLVRHYFHGQTSVEIARDDGVADSTVRGRLKEAVDALRRKLDDRHRGDRAAWTALVAPLAAPSRPMSYAASVAGALVSMNLVAKIGIGTALVLAGIAAWRVARTEATWPSGSDVSVTAASIELERGEVDAPGQTAARTAGSDSIGTSAAPTAATAESSQTIVQARIVDTQGAPIPGATMVCTNRIGPKDLTREEAPQATSDDRGEVHIALSRADERRNSGRDATMGEDEWFANLEISAVARARVTIERRLKLGTTMALGDVVLADAGDIIGRVVGSAGQGLADADVELRLPGLTIEERDTKTLPWTGERLGTRSAQDGSFSLRGVRCGMYRLHAHKSGMLAGISDTFELRAGEEFRAADLVVAEDPRAVRGRVLDADGNPCVHAELSYAASGREDTWVGTDVGKDGSFVIELGSLRAVDLHAATSHEDTGDAVARNVAPGTSDVVLRLGKPVWIDMSVRDPRGVVVPGCLIGVYDLSGQGGGGNQPQDSQGRYHLRARSVPFHLDVSAPGFERLVLGPFDPSALPGELGVTLKPVASVSGRVSADGQMQRGAFVYLMREADTASPRICNGFPTRFETEPREYVRTSEDGTFSFDSRRTGRFIVAVQAPGFALFESKDLDLSPEQGAPDLEVRLARGGAVEGRLLDDASDAVEGRWVTASRGLGLDVSAAVDPQGRFRIENLAAGRWWLRRTKKDMRSRTQEVPGAPNDPTLTTVEIVDGSTTTLDIDARRAPDAVLLGRFSVAGSDMRSWTASLVAPGEDRWNPREEPISRDGSFRFAVGDIGRVPLTLLVAGSDERDARLEIELDLAPGENRWSLDVPTGELDVDGPALERGLLAHVRRFEKGATLTTRFRSKDGGPLALALMPAGPAQIVDAQSGAVLAEVDVPAAGSAHVTLP